MCEGREMLATENTEITENGGRRLEAEGTQIIKEIITS